MGKLIKIPKEQAELIGVIKFRKDDCDCEINPFCSEQKDGSFLMTEDLFISVKEIPEVKIQFDKVDFTSLERITKEQSDLKEIL